MLPADADCNQSDPGSSSQVSKIWTNPPADENGLIAMKSMGIFVGKFSKRCQEVGGRENILCIVRNNSLFSYCVNDWKCVIFIGVSI